MAKKNEEKKSSYISAKASRQISKFNRKLTAKLEATTGKKIDLQCSVDAASLGGLRLSYDGKQVDGTVKTKLDSIGKLLKNTVL